MMEGKVQSCEGSIVCVTGASGFIASWLVKRLLERGYHVRAVVRDPKNSVKVSHLLDLPNASTHLSLWKGDLVAKGSYDDAIQGCFGVFHLATPMDFATSQDPEKEIIKPAVDGVVNVMRSCAKAKTVKKVICMSSIAAITIQKQPPENQFDETIWTDVDLCRTAKMTTWSYLVSKTLAEKAALEFAKSNGLSIVTVQPSLVMGPFLTHSVPAVMEVVLALLTKNASIYPMLMRARVVHLDDVCNAIIFLFEHQTAEGRFICSSHNFNIVQLAKSLSQKFPEYNIPTAFDGINEATKVVPCSSKKLMDLGFKFKYDPKDYDAGALFAEAIECCKPKGLLPPPNA